MRILFVVGIVSVVVLTAWLFILSHDMKRFERELAVGPEPQQGSKNGSNKAFVQNENTHEPLENAETSIQSTESLESVTSPNNTNTDKGDTASGVVPITASEAVPMDTQQKSTDTQLSPKLKKLFTAYLSIDKEMTTYNTEQLLPLQNQCFSSEERKKEIINALLSGVPDQATTDALYKELDGIKAWRDENLQSMFDLQDKVKQIEEKGSALLKEYGYSSFDEFWNTHGKTYETWESE